MKGQPTAFRSQSEFSCCHNALGHFAKNKFSPFEANELGPLANESLLLLPRSFPFSGKHSSPLQFLPLQRQLLLCLCLGPAGPETCTTTAQSWASCFFLMLMLCFSPESAANGNFRIPLFSKNYRLLVSSSLSNH